MADDTTKDDTDQIAEVEQQLTLDQADADAGYRTVIDDGEVDQLQPGNPNLAVFHGSNPDAADPDTLGGDPADDDDVTAVNAALAQLGGAH